MILPTLNSDEPEEDGSDEFHATPRIGRMSTLHARRAVRGKIMRGSSGGVLPPAKHSVARGRDGPATIRTTLQPKPIPPEMQFIPLQNIPMSFPP